MANGNSLPRGTAFLVKGLAIFMKIFKLPLLVIAVAAMLFLFLPNLSWAADTGAALFKTKCAMCHGADATGKPAAHIPSLVSAEAKQLSDAQITDNIANGGPSKRSMHAFSQKGLSPEQIQSLVGYIRELQKK
jgi:mono/diheme cytochrome c family protein